MHRLFLLIFLIALKIQLTAQEKTGLVPQVSVGETTLVSSGNDLPFWMSSNKNGTI